MISSEELAEVRRAVEGNLSCGDYDAIADWALPKLLADLDAANTRIAELESAARHQQESTLHEIESENHGLTMDHKCVACLRIECCEERIAQLESWGREDCEPLKRRIAELEAAARWRPEWIPGQYSERGVWIVCRQSEPNNADGLMGPWIVEWKDGEGKWCKTLADDFLCGFLCGFVNRLMKDRTTLEENGR